MSAMNIVKMKVKPEFEKAFLEEGGRPGHEVEQLIKQAYMTKIGDCHYCFVGLWDSMDDLVAARSAMIAHLDKLRHMLVDLGNGMGVTDPVSGEVVETLH